MKQERVNKTGAGLLWLLKMAWRDTRADTKKLILFLASIVLGVAAVVSIQSFSQNLKQNVSSQSKTLMGADFVIDSRQLPNKAAQHIIDSLKPAAREVRFSSMAAFGKVQGSKLVQVKGIEGAYPLYGTLETSPPKAATTFKSSRSALVDSGLMMQFKLQEGDSIKIGDLEFRIAGSLEAVPGSTAMSSAFAPTVVVPFRYIEAMGLLQLGSRQTYNFYFKADENTDLLALQEKLEKRLELENADLDTHLDVSRRLGRTFDNFNRFLNLVAFIALLLGCMGIASAIHIYVKQKLRSVAVLKLIGATRAQAFYIYLIQIAGMGFAGALLGVFAGLGIQQFFPFILKDFLPFDLELTISWEAIFMGFLPGFFLSLLFALPPLLNTWYVSPLQALRIRDTPGSRLLPRALVLGAIVVFVYIFSVWILKDSEFAMAFVFAILISFLVLAGVATLLMKLIKRFFPKRGVFVVRQSLLNLYRPNNQTTVLIVTIGVGAFLISTLYFTHNLILDKVDVENSAESPNIILLDIQTEQEEAVLQTLRSKKLDVIDRIPIVTMRVHSLRDSTVSQIKRDTASGISSWILNHEFRVTYRGELIGSEAVLEGAWQAEVQAKRVPAVSFAEFAARQGNLQPGDAVVFNVQGLLLETVVGSIRTVDWGRVQLNFSVLFPEGVLEKAPQFKVFTLRTPNAPVAATLQQEIVQKFPNVSVLDLRQMLSLIEGIVNKISWVISFMALFSIITGIIVLLGAIRNSKYQRIRESVLLRTLGASSRQIFRITFLEYFYLGFVGSASGLLLSIFATHLLAEFVFDTFFLPPILPFVLFLLGFTALVLIIGMSNSREVINKPPFEVLRRDNF